MQGKATFSIKYNEQNLFVTAIVSLKIYEYAVFTITVNLNSSIHMSL